MANDMLQKYRMLSKWGSEHKDGWVITRCKKIEFSLSGDRTHDLKINGLALYQLSYQRC